jgi:hypothetical protein
MSGSTMLTYRPSSDPSIIATLSSVEIHVGGDASADFESSPDEHDPTSVESVDHESPNPFKFERRQCERFAVHSHASMIRITGERFGEILDLELIDYSAGGFGAFTDKPIEPGATVSIGFEMPGCPARQGMVLSCRPCGHGYRIAVKFERAMAA